MERRQRRPERRTPAERQAQLDRIEAKVDEALRLLRRLTGDFSTYGGGPGVADRTYKVVIDETSQDVTGD